MNSLYPYVGGAFIKAGNTRKILAPYNDALVATVDFCDTDALEKAIQAALQARGPMKELSSYEKFTALRFISDTITTRREELARTLAMEAAKPWAYALAEIDRAAQTFLVAAEETKRIPKEYISLDWTTPGKGREGIVKYFPVGAVAGISPFNFPMNLAVHKIAPAIAAGCPIVLKPASSTPVSTLLLAEIIAQTDLPAGAVNIVPCERKAGDILVTDERFGLLSFTGSDEVGWDMKKRAGKKKTVLELGGNAGVIISETADISSMTDAAAMGAFAYQGQICIHAQRFFVHRKYYSSFVEALKSDAEKLSNGAPEDKDTKFSVMIDSENASRVEAWVKEAVSAGAKLVTGGKKEGKYYAPTILTDAAMDMKVNSEEVFGPVVTVAPFDGFSEAIDMLNRGRFGLQAGVYTESVREMEEAFNGIEAGGIILNNMPTVRFDHMPYGGLKDSGQGREGVRYAMHDMLEPRILVK